jgi:FtsH-binding integral membrane protein
MQNEGLSKFFSKVYMWMFIGLLTSGVVSYLVSSTASMSFVLNNYTIFALLEIIMVVAFVSLRRKASPTLATVLFLIYAAMNGATLSIIFLAYSIKSILFVFIASALMYGGLAIYGYTTKKDLTNMGKLLLFGLIAIIVVSLINIFVGNSKLDIILSVVSICVFLGLTAWDMQSLKMIYNYYSNDKNELRKASIYGALDLYLDFINVFLNLLRLFGKAKD